MPERVARRRIVGDEVSRAVAAEEEIAGRGQQTHRAAFGQRMPPANLARPVVERLDVALPPASGSGGADRAPAVAFGPFVGVGEVLHAVGLRRADVEQSRFRAEARRRPVGGRAGRHEHAVDARVLRRIVDWLSFRVHAE